MNTPAPVIEAMTMEERMTVCNMSIEGGARCGYINPDETTFAYLEGRERVPTGAAFDAARMAVGRATRAIQTQHYDDVVVIDGSAIEPTVTWGVTPAQALGIGERIPRSRRRRGVGSGINGRMRCAICSLRPMPRSQEPRSMLPLSEAVPTAA